MGDVKTINDVIEKLGLHDKARKIEDVSDWYNSNSSPTLAEYSRYSHRVVCDFIDKIRANCKSVSEIFSLVDKELYSSWNEYKFYQHEHFDHFAELAMVKYQTLSCLFDNVGHKCPDCGVFAMDNKE